jgi:DNA-binding NtrC family response regulator
MSRKDKKKEVILVVDDSQDTLEMIQRNIEYLGYSVFACDNAQEAMDVLSKNHIDLVITDYHMPFVGGIDVIRHVRDNYKNTEVMMITGYASVEGAVEAIKAGAEEYLSKPFTEDELEAAINRSIEKLALRTLKNESHSIDISSKYGLIGDSKEIRRVAESIKKASFQDLPVLISGEPGTGKEFAARAIHYEGENSECPFFYVNCSGIPENKIEGELFGYVRTGSNDKETQVFKGFFEMAQGGTVFLDEISSTSLATQVKLLRALSGEVTHIGDNTPRKIRCRIIASTSKDLLNLVKRSLFREDLFFRMNVINISMPSLRERGGDIILMANSFIAKSSAELGKKKAPQLDEKAAFCLVGYSWPGNVRELELLMKQVVSKTDRDTIEITDLPSYMRFNIFENSRLNKKLADVEIEHIKDVLESVEGNKTKAAEILGIDRKTLRDKMKKV